MRNYVLYVFIGPKNNYLCSKMHWWLQLITAYHGACAEAVIRNICRSQHVFQKAEGLSTAEQGPK